MAQPTGSTNVNSAWISKGLKAGIYLTQNGAFVFDNGATTVSAANGSFQPNASNTELSTPNGDRIYKPTSLGATGNGSAHVGLAGTFQPMFASSKTVVLDVRMVPFGPGLSPGIFFLAGGAGPGEISILANNISPTETDIVMKVGDPSYGGETSSSYRLTGTDTKRIAFRRVGNGFIDVFVNGVKVEPQAKSNNSVLGVSSVGGERFLFYQTAYAISPSGSHMLMFDTALSDADIATLSADPWTVFTTGTPPAGTVTIGNVTQTTNSATVTYSYVGADATGYEYRLAGGPATTLSASPAVIPGLTPSTAYTVQVRAVNASGVGAWSTAYSFNTNAPVVAALTLSPIKNNAGTLLANETNVTAIVSTLAGANVVTKTGLTSNASGVIIVQDSAMTAGTTYRVVVILQSGAEGFAKVVAA